MLTPSNHDIAQAGFRLRGAFGAEPLAFWDFRNIFLPNIDEDHKKSYHLSAGPLAMCHLLNPAMVIALRS